VVQFNEAPFDCHKCKQSGAFVVSSFIRTMTVGFGISPNQQRYPFVSGLLPPVENFTPPWRHLI